MAGFSRRFSAKQELKDVYKAFLSWCSFVDIKVLRSNITDANFKIMGKKIYKSSIKFRWGIAVLLFFLGGMLAAIGDVKGDSPAGMIMVLLPVAIYVIYYFSQARGKSVEFEFNSTLASSGGIDGVVKVSEECDDAMSELNQILVKFI